MILAAALAAAIAASAPATPSELPLSGAAHAIAVGRLDQARLMISRAMAGGAPRARVERLLADLAFAAGNNAEALARYEQLLQADPDAAELCEKAGIAALKLGEVASAQKWIECATNGDRPSWRAWNARGAIADHFGDWDGADRAYGRAAELAPDRPEVLNNLGWSHLLRGDWQSALDTLTRAAKAARGPQRIANNLELARVALEAALPERRAGEAANDWAHRLNDAGMAARLIGNRQKAIAAFARALEASETWYVRAANNLDQVTAAK